jgi:predicted transcriptional regulator
MRQAERLETILEWLSGNGSVNVADISDELGVSAATVRRDLDLLERQRLLARTHGGAVAQGVFYELPLRYKGGRHKEEKLRIAREAATRVAAGHAVGLTGGHHRGRPGPGRPPAPHPRHQRPEHRLRWPSAPTSNRRDRRRRPVRVL